MKRNLQKGILVTSACAAFLLGNVQQAYAVAADAIEIVQQNKKIAGIVVDQNGEAVIGANVIQKGTTNGPSPTLTVSSPWKCLQKPY